ncbi:VOC family protein [Dyadobacter sp. 3J3]|uniref:VOC family protein n=1 Tax=Dyadobacter sp. 3J3 TaxID=2606600 RepID=UPI00135BBB35|nr:VOC family protein [Dyadobacter sp. 3J3]
MKFIGIDHPAVAADDVENLADWYCNVFGYEKWFRHRNVEPDKPVWMLRAPDNTLLEIMPKDETIRQSRTTWTPGWSHLAFRVENIEESITFLDAKGIVWGGAVINAIGGGKVRNAFDCEGNMIQILERINL